MDKYKLVLRRKFGVLWHVALVVNYGLGIEETVMTTEKYSSKAKAKRAANQLAADFDVEIV